MMGLECSMAAAIALSAAAAGAQGQTAKEVEPLVRKGKATVQAIADTRAQLLKTMQAHGALMSSAISDLGGPYKKLQRQIGRTQEARAKILFRAAEMDAEAETLFKRLSDPAAAERLAAIRARHGALKTAGRDAADLYTQFMARLQDQVDRLGRNLNLLGISDAKPEAAQLEGEAQQLVARIDQTLGAANEAIAALSGP
jgi:Protein of unknown function (DUF2959)